MMALKVKAVERLVKFNKEEDADVYRYVMNPELYIAKNGRYPPTQNGDIRSLF
jgi:hypothetical protein